ncbi:MAG TPA: adenylate/guanylate cyclase domain-containing protein [Methyloceanibacter sp.]|nr:adenylate/guanylate cyclase domain-containing protein [Methyloceanibacter sp.]
MASERAERRLAAILAADVVGYSRLMGRDEEGTLTAIKGLRHSLFDPKVSEHRGRIFKTTGDGALVEFASAVDAMRCAIEVQRAMAERNMKLPDEWRIKLRIGINVGDIIIEDGDVLGDGVNIAARLEGMAEPGGICISDDAYRQVRDKLDIQFQDAGEQQLKNIARPVRIYRAQMDSSAQPKVPLPLPDKPSIAVLPFQNMSGDPLQEYFADGVVEDIITGLSRIKWLLVIARNSSFTYKGRAVDVKQVSRDLGVRYVVEGSVRKAGKRVRIGAQVVEAETGIHVWAERYDRPLDDIFALEDEITLSVVGAIEPSLRAAEIERVKRKRPDSLDAYDLVLRALPHVYAAMPEDAAKAVPLLEQALALEPDYASAHGLLAWCQEILFLRAGGSDENRAAAIRHGHGAVEHGRDDATALALGAFAIAMVEHDRVTAFEAFERALALSPSCSFALSLGSVALAWGGEAERAIEWAERGLRLSPVDRLDYIAYHGLAVGHFLRGRYEEAASAARRSIQSSPGFSVSHGLLAAPLAKLGRMEEARAAAKRVLELQPSFSAIGFCSALALPTALAKPIVEAWREAGLPP